jgi:hypothetical protein
MNDLYQNWKQLLQSPDLDNMYLALSIAPSLDWEIIAQDTATIYLWAYWQNIIENTDIDLSIFVALAKKNNWDFVADNDNLRWLEPHYFYLVERVLALNPKLKALPIYSYSLLESTSLFWYFLGVPSLYNRLDSDTLLACFREHGYCEQSGNGFRLNMFQRKRNTPLNIIFDWDFLTELKTGIIANNSENIEYLYQMRHLEELTIEGFTGDTLLSFDFSRLDKLLSFSLQMQQHLELNISNGGHLEYLEILKATQAQAEHWLNIAPNIEYLDLSYYRGAELPQNIGSLQKLKILNLNNAHTKLNLKALAPLSALKELTLNYTKFEELPALLQLESLNLNDCEIEAMPFSLLKMCALLRLNIANNRIAFYKEHIFRDLLSRLIVLDISNSLTSRKSVNALNNLYKALDSKTKLRTNYDQ